MATNDDRTRRTASNHIFAGLGDAPWRYLGLHESKRPHPPQRTRLDMEALKTSSFMYVVLARNKRGEMMGNGGVAFRGDYKTTNTFLGYFFAGTSNRLDIVEVRELIVKKVDLGCKDSDWGRTPQVKIGQQELELHLVFKNLKSIPTDTPFVTVYDNRKRVIIGIGELVGFNFENVDERGFGDRIPYTNPNKDAIVAHLDKLQSNRKAWLQAQAEAEELKKQVDEEPEHVVEVEESDTDDEDGDNPLN